MTNREIDALVAKYVMGYTRFFDERLQKLRGEWWSNDGISVVCEFEFYSTSIMDAWKVVDKLTSFVPGRDKPWWSVAVFNVQKGQHSAMVYQSQPGMNIHDTHDEIAHAVADTATMAICLAALKAVGVEVPHDAA